MAWQEIKKEANHELKTTKINSFIGLFGLNAVEKNLEYSILT